MAISDSSEIAGGLPAGSSSFMCIPRCRGVSLTQAPVEAEHGADGKPDRIRDDGNGASVQFRPLPSDTADPRF